MTSGGRKSNDWAEGPGQAIQKLSWMELKKRQRGNIVWRAVLSENQQPPSSVPSRTNKKKRILSERSEGPRFLWSVDLLLWCGGGDPPKSLKAWLMDHDDELCTGFMRTGLCFCVVSFITITDHPLNGGVQVILSVSLLTIPINRGESSCNESLLWIKDGNKSNTLKVCSQNAIDISLNLTRGMRE